VDGGHFFFTFKSDYEISFLIQMSEDEQIILICAVPRSGSTTLQRLFHEAVPDSHFCGENAGAVNSLLEFYRQIKRTIAHPMNGFTYSELIEKDVKPSWYNVYDLNVVIEQIRSMIRGMFAHARIWGFKEIRYENGRLAYLEEFRELFPSLRCVLLIRENIQQQSQSGWLSARPNAIRELEQANRYFKEFHQKHTDYTYLMSFERLFRFPDLCDMFKTLLPNDPPNWEIVKHILTHNLKD